MKQGVKSFVQLRRLAVVGVSRSPKKFGNTICKEMTARGYQVYGVNPCMSDFEGTKCYESLSALKGKVDGVVVCVSPRLVEGVLRETAELGLKHVWLQQGAGSHDAVEVGKDLGLSLVTGKCILMYAEPVRSIHCFHRFFVKLFGKL